MIILILLFITLVLIIICLIISCTCYENYKSVDDYQSNNKDIPSTNIVMYMTYDKDYQKEVTKKTSALNKSYCDKYGFDFHKFILKVDDDKKINYKIDGIQYKAVPHYGRYLELYNIMDQYSDDTFFIYIDSDAAVIEQDFDIRDWIPKSEDIYIVFGNEVIHKFGSKIGASLRRMLYGIIFNSGVIIVRNNKWSKQLFKDILTSETCEYTRMHKILNTHDQSCISNIYYNNLYDEHKHIKVISQKNKIQYNDLDKNVPILHAFGGDSKKFDNISL